MARQIRIATVVVGNELRRRIRNRSALIMAFAAPLSMAVVFSLLVQGGQQPSFTIGVVDGDRSGMSAGLAGGLISDDGHGVSFVARDLDAANAEVRDGGLGAAIVIEPGFAAGIAAGSPARLSVLRHPERTFAGLVARAVADSIAATFGRVSLSATVAADLVRRKGSGLGPAEAGARAAAAAQRAGPVLTVSDGAVGGRGVDSGAFYGAAMAVIFSYFTVALATRSVFDERSNGTFARMLVSGARPSSVVAAKTLAVAVISIAGFATVRGVTTLGFGAEWGSASAVLAVIIATVWSIAGVVTLIAGLARTPRQAESLTAAVSFTFALLGGNFVGPVLPEGLEQLSRLTPNGWSLPAFVELNTGSGGVREVAASVAVLCAIGLVAGTLGMWRLNRGVPR